MSVDIIAATPRRERLTQWSSEQKHMLKNAGPTDDWSKMKIRAMSTTPRGHCGLASMKSVQFSGTQTAPVTPRGPGAQYGDGRVDPVGHAVLSAVPRRDLHGAGPDNYSLPPIRTKSSRSSLKTAYSLRAKENYVYWYKERPKPTGFGRYGIGAYKTVLGLGSAPRT